MPGLYSPETMGWDLRLREVFERSGLSKAELARQSGVPYDNVNKYLRGGVSQPRGDAVEKLATALGVEALWLRTGVSDKPPVDSTAPRDLPIYGHVRAGIEGFFMDNGEPQGFTERPDLLKGNKTAYAVRVHDTSMEPVFRHDCLVWVDPARSPAPGDDVIIQLSDSQAFIKQLIRRTEKHLICFQHNPPEEVRFPAKNVSAVHLVVGGLRIRT